MKLLLTLFLCLSFVLGPFSTVWGDGAIAPTAERELMSAIRERVSDSFEFNLARAKTLEACLENQKSNSKDICDALVNYIHETTRRLYPNMRHYQFTMNLLSASNFSNIQAKFSEQLGYYAKAQAAGATAAPMPVVEMSPFFMGLQDNPLESAIAEHLTSRDAIQNPPFSTEEIQSFLRNDVNFKITMPDFKTGKTVVKNYPLSFDGHLQMYCDNIEFDYVAEGCRKLHLTYNGATQKFNFYIDKDFKNGGVSPQELGYRLWALDLSRYDLYYSVQDMHRRFYELIQLYPFLALAPSANLSTQDMLKMSHVIVKSAENAYKKFKEFRDKSRKGQASRGEELSLFNYSAIVDDVLAHPSEGMATLSDLDPSLSYHDMVYGYSDDDSKKSKIGLADENAKHESRQMGVHVLALIGANLAVCGLPIERAGALIFKGSEELIWAARQLKRGMQSFSFLCFAITNTVVNFGFGYVDMLAYVHSYDEIFGYLDNSSNSGLVNNDRTRNILKGIQKAEADIYAKTKAYSADASAIASGSTASTVKVFTKLDQIPNEYLAKLGMSDLPFIKSDSYKILVKNEAIPDVYEFWTVDSTGAIKMVYGSRRHFIREIHDLDDNRRELFWSIVSMALLLKGPVADVTNKSMELGVGVVADLAKAGVSLSKDSASYLIKMFK
jgi:hypothetical protein